MYRIIVLNFGSTSSKVAYYEGENRIFGACLEHPASEIAGFDDVLKQYRYRFERVNDYLQSNGVDYHEADAIVGRGGNTRPIEGGVYRINEVMLGDIVSGRYGRHPSDLDVMIAHAMSTECAAVPMVVDPPVTDEFETLARYSGMPELPRRSSFHALNQRACARKYAKDRGVPYEELNLIGVHLGGGISVCAHLRGRMVDANNALEGDGPFSTNRTGALPVGALIEMCYSGRYTLAEMKKKINGFGGLIAYTGESDIRTIEQEIANGNLTWAECYDAMLYQVCKEIGGISTVLYGKVDAILLTGGMANSKYVQSYITRRTGFIAPVVAYPGEFEMEALASGAYAALTGLTTLKEM